MAQYLLIESRDPFETTGVADDFALAASLAAAGNEVTLFLVQNGVLPVRKGAHTGVLEAVRGSAVELLADDFSLRERAISPDELADGVRAAPLDTVVDRMAEGHKTVWL